MGRVHFRTYLGIYLVSAATLTYEIGLTRLYSIAEGYHFAFMVISISLLGIGAGGSVLMAGAFRSRQDFTALLPVLSALFSITAVVSYATANQILFDPVKASWSKTEFLKVFAEYLILSLPFVLSGMIIAAAIKSMSPLVHRLYLADLAGAATGCLLILAVLSYSGGAGPVIASALLAIGSALCFGASVGVRSLAPAVAAATIVLAAVLAPGEILEVRMSPYRDLSSALNFPGGRLVETINAPEGRIDIVEGPAVRSAPGISLGYSSALPEQLGFTVNGGGLSTVTSRTGDMTFLRHLPGALPYNLAKGADVFVVDPGGGMEVLSAFENGASGVWGSETNGAVKRVMNSSLLQFSGGLYRDAEIRAGYGRNVLKGLDRRFDLIVLPRTNTMGASSSGIRGLAEDYSLTAEAFAEYISRLSPGGFVAVTMYLLPPPRQSLKLLATVVAALERTGLKDPGSRIIAIRSWGVLCLMVKNGEVTVDDIDKLRAFIKAEGFDAVWYPGMKRREANTRNRFEEPFYYDDFSRILDQRSSQRFIDGYIFDISPATDEKPFFSRTFKTARLMDTYRSVGGKWGILMEGGYLLPLILIQAIIASIILIVAPVLASRMEKAATGVLVYTSVFFAAIGAGFMFVEISLIQKMILVAGEPVYAISAVLFTLLLSTGAGSYISGRLRLVERSTVNVLLVIPVIIIAYMMILGTASGMIAGYGRTARYALTFVMLVPAGLAMGMAFPEGMRLLGDKNPELVPWAWCVNGSVSVASSVAVMIVALAWGFSTALAIAAGLYVVAWAALARLKRAL